MDLVEIDKAFLPKLKGPFFTQHGAQRVGATPFEETWRTTRTPGLLGRRRGEMPMVGGIGTFKTGPKPRNYEIEAGIRQNRKEYAPKRKQLQRVATRRQTGAPTNPPYPDWMK